MPGSRVGNGCCRKFTITPKGRTWSTEHATIDELRETMANGTACAGRYEVDATAHTVTHVCDVNLEPVYERKRLVRKYELDGDELRLSDTFEYQGETIRFTITWVCASDATSLLPH